MVPDGNFFSAIRKYQAILDYRLSAYFSRLISRRYDFLKTEFFLSAIILRVKFSIVQIFSLIFFQIFRSRLSLQFL